MTDEKKSRPTFKQIQALKVIRQSELTEGWQMTVRMLAERLGIGPTATHERINQLRTKGLLKDQSRIELTDNGRSVADGEPYGV